MSSLLRPLLRSLPLRNISSGASLARQLSPFAIPQRAVLVAGLLVGLVAGLIAVPARAQGSSGPVFDQAADQAPTADTQSDAPRPPLQFVNTIPPDQLAFLKDYDGKSTKDLRKDKRFHKLMDKHKNFWVKTTAPERMTIAGSPFDDVVPFGRALVENFPDRVIWGTDWPHPNMKREAPDDGVLVDFVPKIATTAELQQKLLVDNPMRLYWS